MESVFVGIGERNFVARRGEELVEKIPVRAGSSD
jgi:hypothetical protein